MNKLSIRKQQNAEIAYAIRTLRTGAGLTQDQAAHKLKIVKQTYQKYEIGENLPSIFVLVAIAKLFNVPHSEFVKTFRLCQR